MLETQKFFSFLKVQQFVCQDDGDCLISYKYRRSCNCCRLAKCFRVGMQKKSILSDEARETRNKLVETNRLKRGTIRQRPCDEWVFIKYILMNIRLSLD